MPRWLCDENGKQVTPSIDGQPIEEGDAAENNYRRFTRTRDGLHLVFQPIQDPSLYWKMPGDPEYFEMDGGKKTM